MWLKYSRGDRYVASVNGIQVYDTNSAKGMRDKLVILLIGARRYDTVEVTDTVTGVLRTFTPDTILDWRI